MRRIVPPATRRGFLVGLGATGTALALGASAEPTRAASAEWDVSWIERIRQARHRAVFDAPGGIDTAPMLAARFLDNVEEVFGARAPRALAVLNLRTRASGYALSDALWARYAIAEDYKANDGAGAPVRRNPAWRAAPGAPTWAAEIALERLHARGALFLVCDFALGHLAERLAKAAGSTRDAVHRDLKAGLVPGAVLVPSGILGLTEAQNAGCAFVSA